MATYSFETFVSLEDYFKPELDTLQVAENAAADLKAGRESAEDEIEDYLGADNAKLLNITSVEFVEFDGAVRPHHNAVFLATVEGPGHLINALKRAIEEE